MNYIYDGIFYYEDEKKISKKKYQECLTNIHAAAKIVSEIRAGKKTDIPEYLAELVKNQMAALEELDKLKPLPDIHGDDVIRIVFSVDKISRTEALKIKELINKAGITEKDWRLI